MKKIKRKVVYERKAGDKCYCGNPSCILKSNGRVTLNEPLKDVTDNSNDVLGLAESKDGKYEVRHKNNAFVLKKIE